MDSSRQFASAGKAKGAVARAALAAGADLVNDVSALADPDLARAVAEAGCPVVLMHARGTPRTMQGLTDYDDLVATVPPDLVAAVCRGLAPAGVDALTRFTAAALEVAEDKGCEEMLGFATSAVRDATNSEAVLDHVKERTGVEIEVLPGDDEARLTFLAVRRWFGWSSGRLLVLDIGGGSLEVAVPAGQPPVTSSRGLISPRSIFPAPVKR